MHSAVMGGAGDIKVFAGSASKTLAEGVAGYLKLRLGRVEASRFGDGESCVQILESVRGCDVYIIQSTAPPVNDSLMELLIMIDAMRRCSAGRITAVIPYYGYARQDRIAKSRDPISAKLVADLLTQAGADRVLSMDLHCPQIQGFFNIPMDHLQGVVTFLEYYRQNKGDYADAAVVSTDVGGAARCNVLADAMDVPLAIIHKRREKPGKSEATHFVGDVCGKHAVILDDVIASGGSLVNAAAILRKNGAARVTAFVTHPVLSEDAAENIGNSSIDKLVVLDTIAVPPEKLEKCPKLEILSVAARFGEVINRIHGSQSVSALLSIDEFLGRE